MSTVRYNFLRSFLIFAGIFYDYGTCSPSSQEEHKNNLTTPNSGANISNSVEDTGCKSKINVTKCCTTGHHFNSAKCIQSEYDVDFKFPKPISTCNNTNTDFEISYGQLQCSTFLLDPTEDHFDFYENGTLNVLGFGQKGLGEFCFEYDIAFNVTKTLICHDDINTPYTSKNKKFKIFAVGQISSIVFLALTLIIHFLINQRQPQSMHSALLRCHILTFILQYGCLLILQQVEMQHGFVCIFLGYLTQFCVLANFFWMNAMCIHMWLTLTKSRHPRGFTRRIFQKYCLYAVGIPFTITLTASLTQFFHIFGNTLVADVGHYSCLFHDFWAKFVFLYLFVAIIIIFNACLFGSIALTIFNVKENDNSMGSTNSRTCGKNPRKKFFFYLKLFLIMGLNWSFEVLSFGLQKHDGIFWYTDNLNNFQGVFIFAIVICNRKTLNRLNEELYPRRILFGGNTAVQRRNGITLECQKNGGDTIIATDSPTMDSTNT